VEGSNVSLPEAKITEQAQTVVGLDGRKMSKSYDNTIPLFCSEKQLKKIIGRIVEFIDPGLRYEPTGRISRAAFQASKIVDQNGQLIA